MSNFTDEELLQIIETGESDAVEFKESLSGSASERIREAICAFANDLPDHRNPGLVLVGVKDDTTIGTMPITDELLRRLNARGTTIVLFPLIATSKQCTKIPKTTTPLYCDTAF